MALTIADLGTRVLQKLRELEAEETADAADQQLVESVYAETVDELAELGIVYWTSSDSIPDPYVRAMVLIVAANVADEFNVPDIPTWLARKEGAMRTMRRMSRGKFDSEVIETDYY